MKPEEKNNEIQSANKTSVCSVIALFFCTLFLLCAATASTYAWLSKTREVNSSSDMQLDASMVMASTFEAYIYSEETGKASRLTDPNDIKMPLYDSVFIEKNVNNTLIYRVPVFGTAIQNGEPFTVTLNLIDKSEITGISDGNYLDMSFSGETVGSGAIADFISNIITIKCAVIPELQSSEITADDAYKKAHGYFMSSGNVMEQHSFVSIVDSAAVKSTGITFTISDYDIPDENILYVYLELGYDVDLVQSFLNSRGFSLSFDDATIIIKSDLGDFIFEIPETA